MPETHSTGRPGPGKPSKGKPPKPSKPYPEFPLTALPLGYWCKKIRGKIHYFGPGDDPDGALRKYEESRRTPCTPAASPGRRRRARP
jgi:hypothetical protein